MDTRVRVLSKASLETVNSECFWIKGILTMLLRVSVKCTSRCMPTWRGPLSSENLGEHGFLERALCKTWINCEGIKALKLNRQLD